AARFGFAVAPETMALMRSMVANGEADALVAERVWQEFSRGLMEGDPALMFPVLAEAGLLQKVLPELNLAFEAGRPANDAARVVVRSLECAATERLGLAPRFALVASRTDSTEATRTVSERLKAPGECRDLAVLARRHAETVKRAPTLPPRDLLALIERCDAFRRPGRFEELLALTACLERGELGWARIPYMPRTILRRALGAAMRVNASEIVGSSAKSDIPEKLRRARTAAIGALI
ncbi:MAG TPA: multifunctional CCA tRNA nucleotidyl transferase/2'3'-cyclic phosphodiesterase/2'nucleotidase/phosphatase, partial [Burkholderiales bacterium]